MSVSPRERVGGVKVFVSWLNADLIKPIIHSMTRYKFIAGNTLIEAMVTVVFVTIASLGGLSYQYHAAGHTRIAQGQITATRTAQLLLEDWMSTGGSTEYDPTALGFGFSSTQAVPADFAVPTGLGQTLNGTVYAIEVDGLPMVVMLKYNDVDEDVIARVKLRQLSICVAFGEVIGGELTLSECRVGNTQPITLTTYVRVDAAGG
jgi:hypothetical protein